MKSYSILIVLTFCLMGCTPALGPDYVRPSIDIPYDYKEGKGWKIAQPQDEVPKGKWWLVFEDERLNELQNQVDENQELKAAAARVKQARSLVKFNKGEFFPKFESNPEWERQGQSENLQPFGLTRQTFNNFKLPLNLSYEVDLWGRIRRSVESAQNEYHRSISDYHHALLTLRADLARYYFDLVAHDTEIMLLKDHEEIRQRAYDIVENLYKTGEITQSDLFSAETELTNVKIEMMDVKKRRAELEHAIAVLIGKSPSDVSFDEEVWMISLPTVPIFLPSELLERRPDISAAERAMAASNARIGAAKAAFFPKVTLSGSVGYESGDINSVLDWSSRTWSFGPGISIPIFQGGRSQAKVQQARFELEEAVALYRQQILIAFNEVEDGLSGLTILNEQAKSVERAAEASRNSSELSFKRYKAGLVSFLEVVDKQRILLQAEQKEIKNYKDRLIATVLLIKALGGGWS